MKRIESMMTLYFIILSDQNCKNATLHFTKWYLWFFLLFFKHVYYKINTQSGLHWSCQKYKKLVAAFFFLKKRNTVHFPLSLCSPATATSRLCLWGEKTTAGLPTWSWQFLRKSSLQCLHQRNDLVNSWLVRRFLVKFSTSTAHSNPIDAACCGCCWCQAAASTVNYVAWGLGALVRTLYTPPKRQHSIYGGRDWDPTEAWWDDSLSSLVMNSDMGLLMARCRLQHVFSDVGVHAQQPAGRCEERPGLPQACHSQGRLVPAAPPRGPAGPSSDPGNTSGKVDFREGKILPAGRGKVWGTAPRAGQGRLQARSSLRAKGSLHWSRYPHCGPRRFVCYW